MPFVRCLSSCGEERANLAFPRARGRLALRPAPLGNREIAFGCVRLAIRRPCTGPLGWRARSSPRLARARFAAVRRLAPPMRNRLSSRARHPSANAACMARSRCLPSPCNAASRRLPRTGGGLRSGPARRRPSPCALSAHVLFCAAQAFRLHADACARTRLSALRVAFGKVPSGAKLLRCIFGFGAPPCGPFGRASRGFPPKQASSVHLAESSLRFASAHFLHEPSLRSAQPLARAA